MWNESDSSPSLHGFSPWPLRYLSCVALGGMTFILSLLALVSVLLASMPRSRSRPGSLRAEAMALSGRDSQALLLLGSLTGHLVFGAMAVVFGVVHLPSFIHEPACGNLLAVGVASQWGVAFSMPVLTAYYVLLVNHSPKHSSAFSVRAQRRDQAEVNAGQADARAEPSEPTETSLRRKLSRRAGLMFRGVACGRCWAGLTGVAVIVSLVNSLTLGVTYMSLAEIMFPRAESSCAVRVGASFCERFFGCSELFPHQAMGVTFLASALFTAGAIMVLSRGLAKKRAQVAAVGLASQVGDDPDNINNLRLQALTRPPDEGVHHHPLPLQTPPLVHYGSEDDLLEEEDFVYGLDLEAGGEVGPTARGLLSWRDNHVGHVQAHPRRHAALISTVQSRVVSRSLDVPAQATRSRVSGSSTSAQISDSDFYDSERTRHIVQSPPPSPLLHPPRRSLVQHLQQHHAPRFVGSNVSGRTRSTTAAAAAAAATMTTIAESAELTSPCNVGTPRGYMVRLTSPSQSPHRPRSVLTSSAASYSPQLSPRLQAVSSSFTEACVDLFNTPVQLTPSSGTVASRDHLNDCSLAGDAEHCDTPRGYSTGRGLEQPRSTNRVFDFRDEGDAGEHNKCSRAVEAECNQNANDEVLSVFAGKNHNNQDMSDSEPTTTTTTLSLAPCRSTQTSFEHVPSLGTSEEDLTEQAVSNQVQGNVPVAAYDHDDGHQRDVGEGVRHAQRGEASQWSLSELIFPHRQSTANKRRFQHTRVKHVREELVPTGSHFAEGRLLPPGSGVRSTALTIPEIVIYHVVCVSGGLFALAYAMMSVFLLVKPIAQSWEELEQSSRFINTSFEPYLVILLVSASLDSCFCFAALISLNPGWTTP